MTIDTLRTVAADTSSRATFVYVQILFKKFWNVPVTFARLEPNLDRMLEVCDAAVLIGDPALMALEDQDARELRTGESLVYLDLGTIWREFTGQAWVSAVWAARASSMGSEEIRHRVREDFLASRDHGLAHREELVREWAPRLAVPQATIRTYLYENIHYLLDDACVTAMEFFLQLAAECELLPAAPPLSFL